MSIERFERAVVEPYRLRLAVQRDLVEAGAVDHQRPLDAERGSVCATGSSSRGSATPSSCTGGSAGFTQGPSMFMIVRTFSARRTGPAWRRPGW